MTVQEQVAEIQREHQYFNDTMEAHLEKVSRASSTRRRSAPPRSAGR